MRIGSLVLQANLVIALATLISAISPCSTLGQSRYPGGGQGPMQAIYNAPAGSPACAPASRYVDAYGNPMIVPAGFCQECGPAGGQCGPYAGCGPCGDGQCYGGAPCDGCPQGGFINNPNPMGCGGTDPPVGYELMNDVGMEGDLVDQRGPHYWDIRAEAVTLKRDKTFGRNIDITSLNVGNTIVLSTDLLQYDWEPGFRVMGRYDIGPLSVFEFGYMGIFSYFASATANDPNGNLFSLFSIEQDPGLATFGQFGTSPANVNTPGGPNPEFERAFTHHIEMSSDLQTAELSYRRYWLGYHPRISGTLLAGFRYTRVGEEFEFESIGADPPNPQLGVGGLYQDRTSNDLAGGQVGIDTWISLSQGLRFGAEAKVGLYNNHSQLHTKIKTTPQFTEPPALSEEFEQDHAAFIGEWSLDLVADILPSLSIRGGYEWLVITDLALAGDNFNTVSPYGNQGTRIPFFDNNTDLTYHGAHLGIEYCW
jgi:hypothetical protein